MATKKVTTKTYRNIDEILDFVLDEADPESDIEVDLGGVISDDELQSDWNYESEPNATKQSETIPTNVVMAEQSSASSVDQSIMIIIMMHILMKIMWKVLITIHLTVLVVTVIVVPRQMMKDFHHNQKGKKLCERAVVDPG